MVGLGKKLWLVAAMGAAWMLWYSTSPARLAEHAPVVPRLVEDRDYRPDRAVQHDVPPHVTAVKWM